MKFAKMYGEHLKVCTNNGSPIKTEYQVRLIDNNMEIVETGKSDLYEYIQSHKDSVDIHKILERCAQIEDYSLLNRMPTQFMDVTDMPDNLAGAYAMVKDAENFFDRMPVDIKEKYNNNFIEFISDLGSDKFNDNVSKFLDTVKKVTESKSAVKEETEVES